MTDERFILDPVISAMCDGCDPIADMAASWRYMEAQTGVSREQFFANLAHMRLMADIREVSGYMASERRYRGVRHHGISEGAVKPPVRETRADRVRRESIAFGLIEARP